MHGGFGGGGFGHDGGGFAHAGYGHDSGGHNQTHGSFTDGHHEHSAVHGHAGSGHDGVQQGGTLLSHLTSLVHNGQGFLGHIAQAISGHQPTQATHGYSTANNHPYDVPNWTQVMGSEKPDENNGGNWQQRLKSSPAAKLWLLIGGLALWAIIVHFIHKNDPDSGSHIVDNAVWKHELTAADPRMTAGTPSESQFQLSSAPFTSQAGTIPALAGAGSLEATAEAFGSPREIDQSEYSIPPTAMASAPYSAAAAQADVSADTPLSQSTSNPSNPFSAFSAVSAFGAANSNQTDVGAVTTVLSSPSNAAVSTFSKPHSFASRTSISEMNAIPPPPSRLLPPPPPTVTLGSQLVPPPPPVAVTDLSAIASESDQSEHSVMRGSRKRIVTDR